MQFALVFSYDPAVTGPTEGELPDWMALDERIKAAGINVHEAGFHPATEARTVTVRDGQLDVREGVTGSGDVVAGYWVIDVPAIEDAIEWARRIPTATYGKVEVRRVVVFEAP